MRGAGKSEGQHPLRRRALRVSAALLALFVLAVAVIPATLDRLALQAINRAAPSALGVPARIENVVVRPFKGEMSIEGLFVGNPKGFSTTSLLELSAARIELDVRSLFRDPLVVRSITLMRPRITYERGRQGSNLSALREALKGKRRPAAPTTQPGAERKPRRRVIVERLFIEEPSVRFAWTGLGGYAFPIVLESVELTDIGREEGGVPADEIARAVLRELWRRAGLTSSEKPSVDPARTIRQILEDAARSAR